MSWPHGPGLPLPLSFMHVSPFPSCHRPTRCLRLTSGYLFLLGASCSSGFHISVQLFGTPQFNIQFHIIVSCVVSSNMLLIFSQWHCWVSLGTEDTKCPEGKVEAFTSPRLPLLLALWLWLKCWSLLRLCFLICEMIIRDSPVYIWVLCVLPIRCSYSLNAFGMDSSKLPMTNPMI